MKGRPRQYEDQGKYSAQKRWSEKNAKKYAVMLNKNTDQDLIDFLEDAGEYARTGALFRYGLTLAKMFTDNFDILTKYVADNGDEFVRIRTYFNGNVAKKAKPVKCKAVYYESPVPHIWYCTTDGLHIAMAGKQVHEKLGVSTEFLYTKRASKPMRGEDV